MRGSASNLISPSPWYLHLHKGHYHQKSPLTSSKHPPEGPYIAAAYASSARAAAASAARTSLKLALELLLGASLANGSSGLLLW